MLIKRTHQMTQAAYNIRQFIKDEMDKRQMSNREFGDLVGVSHTTIGRAIDETKPSEPTLDFLAKLAKGTNRDLLSLVEIAYPDVADATRPDPSTIILAQRFEELSDDYKTAVMALVNRH